jgi:hypothetical protein
VTANSQKDPDGVFTQSDLRKIAFYQKVVMVYFFLYALAILFGCFLADLLPPGLHAVPFVIFWLGPVALAGLVFKIHPPLTASLLLLFSLGPVVCLAVLVLVIHQTSEIFKRHSVPTGLFGARFPVA